MYYIYQIKNIQNKGNQNCCKVYCEGVIYNSIKEAAEAYGFKSSSAITYRLKSEKWVDFYYIN